MRTRITPNTDTFYAVKVSRKSRRNSQNSLCQILPFNKLVCRLPVILLKLRLWYMCFPVRLRNFSENIFYGTSVKCSSKSGKMRTRITPNTDTFQVVGTFVNGCFFRDLQLNRFVPLFFTNH